MSKFVIQYATLNDGMEVAYFARGDDGMIVGACEGSVARWGEDPKEPEAVRLFISHDHAKYWVKAKCGVDAEFSYIDSQHLVVPVTTISNQRLKM